jgi:hypothetical protein
MILSTVRGALQDLPLMIEEAGVLAARQVPEEAVRAFRNGGLDARFFEGHAVQLGKCGSKRSNNQKCGRAVVRKLIRVVPLARRDRFRLAATFP